VPLALLAIIARQVWLPSLFEKTTPFPEGTALQEMQAIAARCGLGEVPVVVAGTHGATAVGLGPFSRIEFSPSQVEESLTQGGGYAELVAIYAHELRHYMHDNWLPAIAAIALIVLGGALLIPVVGGGAIRIWRQPFGFSALYDPAAFPLALLILGF